MHQDFCTAYTVLPDNVTSFKSFIPSKTWQSLQVELYWTRHISNKTNQSNHTASIVDCLKLFEWCFKKKTKNTKQETTCVYNIHHVFYSWGTIKTSALVQQSKYNNLLWLNSVIHMKFFFISMVFLLVLSCTFLSYYLALLSEGNENPAVPLLME